MNERATYEATLLGQICYDNELLHRLTLRADHFSKQAYRTMYTACGAILARGDTVGIDTLYAECKDSVPVDVIAGVTTAPSAANWEFYQKAIIASWKADQVRKVMARANEWLEESPDYAIEQIDEAVMSLRVGDDPARVRSMPEMVGEYLDILSERSKRAGSLAGISTGFYGIDVLIGGLQRQRLICIGARPSVGKSAMMLNIVREIARKGTPIAVFSIESSWTEVMDRLVAALSGVDSRMVSSGVPCDSGHGRDVAMAVQEIAELPVYLYDKPGASLVEIESHARRLVRMRGVKCVFIDYLQLIRVAGTKERREEVATASMRIKDLARELDIPIVLNAQLGRTVDGRRPHIGDIQWASQVEQDADVILLLHDPGEAGVWKPIELDVAKNRDGAKGAVPFVLHGPTVTFKERDDTR